MRRHDLAFLTWEGWSAALSADPGLAAIPLVRHWATRDFPVTVRRGRRRARYPAGPAAAALGRQAKDRHAGPARGGGLDPSANAERWRGGPGRRRRRELAGTVVRHARGPGEERRWGGSPIRRNSSPRRWRDDSDRGIGLACRRRSRDQAEVATAPEALADERKLEAKRERRDQHAHDVDFAKRQHYWAVLQTRSGSTIRKDVTPNAMPEKIAMLSFRVAARSYCIGLAGWTGA
jgi:hypothetical protein